MDTGTTGMMGGEGKMGTGTARVLGGLGVRSGSGTPKIGFSRNSQDFPGFSRNSQDFQGLVRGRGWKGTRQGLERG